MTTDPLSNVPALGINADNQQTIDVSPAVFDALKHAGLLIAIPATAATPWTTYGWSMEDDTTRCTMIAGERFSR